jgi:transcriptional regulator with XRE-family HTH domain
MEIELTPKELGQRLAKLRKNKGFSQEELSKAVNVSRSSLAQMELGNRRLDIIELYEIAMILGFSIDQFMSGKFSATLLKPHIEKEDIQVERIANPKFNEKKFKKD